MKVSLATPEKKIFSGEATDIVVNAEKGQLQILERHANLITLVKPGQVKINGAESKAFSVSDGVLKVENNSVSILCASIRAA